MKNPGGKSITLKMDPDVVAEVEAEAKRLGRTKAWVLLRAWALAKDEVEKLRHPLPPVER